MNPVQVPHTTFIPAHLCAGRLSNVNGNLWGSYLVHSEHVNVECHILLTLLQDKRGNTNTLKGKGVQEQCTVFTEINTHFKL